MRVLDNSESKFDSRICSFCPNKVTTFQLSQTTEHRVIEVTCPVHGTYTFIETLLPMFSYDHPSGRCIICGTDLTPDEDWLGDHNQDFKEGKTEEIYECPDCGAEHIINLYWRM